MKTCLLPLLFVAVAVGGCSNSDMTTPQETRGSDKTALPAGAIGAREKGREDALADLRQSKIGWRQYGQPMAHDSLYKQVLKDDYGIDLLIVAGCTVSDELVENANGYNEIMMQEIKKRFGKDVIREAEEKARQQFEQQRTVPTASP